MDEFARAIVQFFKDEGIVHELAHMGQHAFMSFVHHVLPRVWEHIRDNIGDYFETVMSFFGFGS